MANKIVLLKKGEPEGVEFSLNAGSNGRGICWDRGNFFWVTLGADIAYVHLNHATNEAEIIRQTTIPVYDTCFCITTFRDHLFVGVELTTVIGMIATIRGHIVLLDRSNLAAIRQDLNLNAILGSGVRDLSWDGTFLWYLFQPSNTVPPANWRVRNYHVPTGTATINNASLGTAAQRGICVNRGGSGLWWADRVKGIHLIDENAVQRHNYTVTHTGTMRCIEDTGPMLAMMFN